MRLLFVVLLASMMTLPADARDKRGGGGSNALKDAADDVKAFRDMPDAPVRPVAPAQQAPHPKSNEWFFMAIVEAKDGTRSIVPSGAIDLPTCQLARDGVPTEATKRGVRIIQLSPCVPRGDICNVEGARDAFAKTGVTSFVDLCR
jgi:hypothetical protein